MSSPLDGRIRAAARAELETLLGGAPSAPDNGSADRVTALEQAVASLTDSVSRLEARLNTLEKTAGQTEQDGRTSVRRTRKPASE